MAARRNDAEIAGVLIVLAQTLAQNNAATQAQENRRGGEDELRLE
ncbi:hypothetical protein A2U01_0072276, partial [Trifolium medium]|nr:hypothetical protein [Trifolium medium]